jgi:hypothetical protein
MGHEGGGHKCGGVTNKKKSRVSHPVPILIHLFRRVPYAIPILIHSFSSLKLSGSKMKRVPYCRAVFARAGFRYCPWRYKSAHFGEDDWIGILSLIAIGTDLSLFPHLNPHFVDGIGYRARQNCPCSSAHVLLLPVPKWEAQGLGCQ